MALSVDRIKITPGYLVIYQEWEKVLRREEYTTPMINQPGGYLSSKSQIKLKLALNHLLYMSTINRSITTSKHKEFNFRVNMISLTLSSTQIHSDYVIKSKMLQPFLRIMRNRWEVENYIWKAESQDNCNIHFHITLSKYIHWSDIRATWNTIQETMGYISRSGITDPNSTDVKAITSFRKWNSDVVGYIGKKDREKKVKAEQANDEHYYKNYMMLDACDLKSRKEVQLKRPIEGKIWDCSEVLKQINCREYISADMMDDVNLAVQEAEWKSSDTFADVIVMKAGGLNRYPHLRKKLNDCIGLALSNKKNKVKQ